MSALRLQLLRSIDFLLLLAALFLFSLTPVFAATDCTSGVDVTQEECEALVALYNSTDGPNWIDHTGWLEDQTVCDWYGILCEAGTVTWLILSNNGLTGTLPAEIGDLTGITLLLLYDNQLSGSIPPEIGNLSNLQSLQLGGNLLNGTIPPEIGSLTTLTNLNLYDNQLTGSIPVEIGNLSQLQYLDLGVNPLSGSIPVETGNLSNLQSLGLNFTQINGPIPVEIGNLISLQYLWLNDNQLTGTIPTAIGNLSSLVWLNLGNNQLTGTIPAAIGDLTNLESLNLYENQLTGSIPVEIGSLTKLSSLSLAANQLSGTIPTELGNLTSLNYLSLSANQLEGPLPDELSNLTNLTDMYIAVNRFSGSIPIWLGNLTGLQNLVLFSNAFIGPIPTELVNLTQLQSLDIKYNALSISGLDAALETFLNTLNDGWQYTQTVPPENVQVSGTTGTAAALTWIPTGDFLYPGYYEVGVSTTDGSSYTFDAANRTINRSATGLTISNLQPNTTYYFVVRTYREPWTEYYPYFPEVTSLNSVQVSGTTTGVVPTEVSTEVPTATVTEVPGTQLLANGGFEAQTGDNKPDLTPWTLKNPTKDKIKCNTETKTVAYTGECAFMFKGSAGELATLQQVPDLAALDPVSGDTLDFSLFLKATNTAAAGKIKVIVQYSDAAAGKLNLTIATNTDYTELTGSLMLASANVTKVKVQVKHRSTAGKVYLDAFSLLHTPGGATGPGSRSIPLP